jgi:hypothetical protein
MQAAIGCRDHSGWAVLVALGGDPAQPKLLARQRVTLVDDSLPRQVYHAALEHELDAAAAMVTEVERAASKGARAAIRGLVKELEVDRHRVVGLAVAAGTANVPTDLATVLASHTFVHAAEGELYRDALAGAGPRCGLAVTRYPSKHAIAEAAAALGVDTSALDERLKALGKPLGPPWQKDHREAAAGALLVLAG